MSNCYAVKRVGLIVTQIRNRMVSSSGERA